MEYEPLASPFGVEPLEEVLLPGTPLAHTLVQIRFPRLTAMASGDDVAKGVALKLESSYPIFTEEHGVGFMATPEGLVQTQEAGRLWRLRSADTTWQMSLGETFLALETSAYPGREPFLERLREILTALFSATRVPYCERVGVRYINRIHAEENLAELSSIVRAEMLGALAFPDQQDKLVHNINQALFNLSDHEKLQVHWGVLPANAAIDPSLPPVSERSWVLDLDAFSPHQATADVDSVTEIARSLAASAYRFFRWAATDDFLTLHGDEV